MNHLLTVVGLWSLALGAVSGFALLAAMDAPHLLERLRIKHPKRVRQVHLDWIIMGVVLIAVSLSVPQLPAWAVALVLFGGVVNPATFVPMMFSEAVAGTRVFQTVSMVSFLSLSTGLLTAALVASFG